LGLYVTFQCFHFAFFLYFLGNQTKRIFKFYQNNLTLTSIHTF
jgi:hypothetical protein